MASSQNATNTNLSRFAWLSIGAALLTIALKVGAYWLTNSVGLLSDALESGANLATAVVALIAVNIAARPANKQYTYGFSKVEFFASGFEGAMILVAAGGIIASAIPRLFNPQPIEQVTLGLGVSVVASLVNLGAARDLAAAGKRYGSITLQADASHLMTDVFTTAGVIVGVGLVALTGWTILDPIIALAVAANILVTAVRLLRRSASGLMDAALPAEDLAAIERILQPYREQGIIFHALRTRTAAARAFVSMHILVPGSWSVARGHDLAEEVECEIRAALPGSGVITHVEPVEHPTADRDDTYEWM